MSSYHGWTHATKAQGGTDPIPYPAAPILRAGLFDSVGPAVASGVLPTIVSWNYWEISDPSIFIVDDGGAGVAFTNVGLRKLGRYGVKAKLVWDSNTWQGHSEVQLVGITSWDETDIAFPWKHSERAVFFRGDTASELVWFGGDVLYTEMSVFDFDASGGTEIDLPAGAFDDPPVFTDPLVSFQVRTRQDSGVNRNLNGEGCRLEVTYLGPLATETPTPDLIP